MLKSWLGLAEHDGRRSRQRLEDVDATETGLSKNEILSTVQGYRQRYSASGDNANLERQFERDKDDIRELGFDEPFRRLWNFYLSYCEAGFSDGRINVGHFQVTRPG